MTMMMIETSTAAGRLARLMGVILFSGDKVSSPHFHATRVDGVCRLSLLSVAAVS
jgi:hypothetical protein